MDAKRSGVLFRKKQCAAKYFTQAGFVSIIARHVLEQFLKMRILEPEDGGGVESQRVRITSKISC
jgi:hypothetical protein